MRLARFHLVAWALVLLVAVSALHYGTEYLATFWPDTLAARRALFYVGQGLKGCLLWMALAVMAPKTMAAVPLLAVCAWGFVEDAMVAGCRIAYGIGTIPSPGLWRGLCDDLTGAPVYLVGPAVGLLAACIVEQGAKKK